MSYGRRQTSIFRFFFHRTDPSVRASNNARIISLTTRNCTQTIIPVRRLFNLISLQGKKDKRERERERKMKKRKREGGESKINMFLKSIILQK